MKSKKFTVLTIFPEMFKSPMSESILKKAQDKGLFNLSLVDIRDFSKDKNKKVDDRPFGGGAGMVMMAEPLYLAHKSVLKRKSKKTRTIFLTPSGAVFNAKKAKELNSYEHLILVCGRYEGVDARFIEECVDEEISIGDFVLSGGELPAMVLIDAVARFIPGVLGNSVSKDDESFELHDEKGVLIEYPQYTRPRVFRKKSVPEVLFSGNHKEIQKFRLKLAREKTNKVRPDLNK